jgi:hypothetical protein
MEIIFTDATGLYLYSALLQANAALLALIGLYIVFRLQSINSRIDSLKSSLFAEGTQFGGDAVRFDSMTLERKVKWIDKLGKDNSWIKLTYLRWLDLYLISKQFKRGVIIPTLLIGVAICLNALFLFRSSSLHINYPSQEICCAFVNLGYELLVVSIVSWKAILLVWKADKDEDITENDK